MENHFKNLLTLSRNNKSLCHLSHHPLLPTSPPLEGSSTLSQSRLWASLIPWSFILQMLSFWQIGFKRFRAPFPQSLFTQSGNLVQAQQVQNTGPQLPSAMPHLQGRCSKPEGVNHPRPPLMSTDVTLRGVGYSPSPQFCTVPGMFF